MVYIVYMFSFTNDISSTVFTEWPTTFVTSDDLDKEAKFDILDINFNLVARLALL